MKKNVQREFFEKLVSEHVNLEEIYELAEKLKIEIVSDSYNIVLFTVEAKEEQGNLDNVYSEETAHLQQQIDELFVDYENCILYRFQQYSYAVVIKGEEDNIREHTQQCVDMLRELFSQKGNKLDWFVCTGNPVDRLSSLHRCYQEAMRAFAFRYLGYQNVFSIDDLHPQEQQDVDLAQIDTKGISKENIRNFLCNAMEEEVESFVENYIALTGEGALASKMFQQYVLLNMRIAILEFLEEIGYDRKDIEQSCRHNYEDRLLQIESLKKELVQMLRMALRYREQRARGKHRSVIQKAVRYMQEHYMEEDLTLNDVACVVNISTNHFSALFSQEMEQTFIEYLTMLRMNRAKELLRCSDKRSGEIALEVGYKDPHYFSFLFKKTQRMTPSEYRKRE